MSEKKIGFEDAMVGLGIIAFLSGIGFLVVTVMFVWLNVIELSNFKEQYRQDRREMSDRIGHIENHGVK